MAYLLAIDFEGNVFASTMDTLPANDASTIHSPHTLNQISKAIFDNNAITDISYPLVDNLGAHLHIGISQHELEEALLKTNEKLLFGILSLSFLAILITIVLSRQISKPIESLSASMRAFGIGKPYIPVNGRYTIPRYQ